ncbi:DNA polymerase III subunit beta [Nocardiopsis sp. CC223A]|uniref:DNA polymerase III subunit beta n=1 Tax=Nocardiopsis sp. CC223A TaxID=3044051 RepID=UPI00278C48A3|nr:DNA polymerase III subunit beta [Nocardiopsis sp. CC223A]
MHKLAVGQDIEVDVEIAALRDTIKRVSLFAERSTPLRISITGEGLVVRSGSEDLGAVAEDVDARIDTDRDLTIHVQAHFLTEALAATPGERARLSLGHPEKPFLIRPGDEEETGLMWLLMPVRQPGLEGKSL